MKQNTEDRCDFQAGGDAAIRYSEGGRMSTGLSRRTILLCGGAALLSSPSRAQSVRPIRIGVLTDLAGVNADNTGPGMESAVKMAVEDSGGKISDAPIEVVIGDHQGRPDIGTNITKQWYDANGVDAIVDVTQTNIALPISDITRERNRVFFCGAASMAFTNDRCTPNTVVWSHDSRTMSFGPSRTLVKEGFKSWYYLAVDYAFGRDLVGTSSKVVTQAGGNVLGVVRHPFGASDMSSFLLQAQSSGAQVLGLATVGDDVTTAIKQAHEFGLTGRGMKMAALFTIINNIRALGLDVTQGLYVTESFYWDLNDSTRAWSARFFKINHKMPNLTQAAHYSAMLHYIKALRAMAGSDPQNLHDGRAVVAKMKEMPTSDPIFGESYLREDGRHIHDFHLFQVKAPAQSKSDWDIYNLIETFPSDTAYLPLSESSCPLVKAAK
jgi:branched-chain amino acid transport system substrate-binding protein